MARKPGPRWRRTGVAVASWVVSVSVAQALAGADIGRAVQRVEEQIEMQLRGPGAPAQEPQPQRSHEDESIEPWELVSV
ncbi:MAG TPA: hypothetical protein VIF15_12585 [Polyangiaceae bacterium]|jgi:hypothetical protein